MFVVLSKTKPPLLSVQIHCGQKYDFGLSVTFMYVLDVCVFEGERKQHTSSFLLTT